MFMLTRMFAYLTVFMYLMVGVITFRVYYAEETSFEVTSSYLRYLSKTKFKNADVEPIIAPTISFGEIKFPVEKKASNFVKVASFKKKELQESPTTKEASLSSYKLPFHEAVVLTPVFIKNELEGNMLALYKEVKAEENVAVAEVGSDLVSTKLAAAIEPEPEFFNYEKEEETKTDLSTESTNPKISENVDNSKIHEQSEEVALDDLVGFDYSAGGEKKSSSPVPEHVPVNVVTTQKASVPKTLVNTQRDLAPDLSKFKSTPKKNQVAKQQENALTADSTRGFVENQNTGYPSQVIIHVTGTDLKKTTNELGFEVRPQDDLGESLTDYNNGEVVLEQRLAQKKMTRSVAVLKRGFAPTNMDLIIEEGSSEMFVPMIEEATFNELLAPFESRGPLGAVLIELDDKVESSVLDVPYSKVINLNEKMQVEEGSSFAYQLFVGVRAGNAMLTYKSPDGEMTSKIIHVHDHELTFETNFFESVENEKIELVEEDLLSKEKTRLNISSEAVREFATEKTARKINENTFKTDFNKTLLAGRKYLELGHQQEPIFVGYREATLLEIPSESFMRYILSKFENGKLGNRCLVQVNLNKKAVRVDVSPESAGESLMTTMQVLDSDGKFYDSVGEKSQKVIVVGENQGSIDYSQDAKINFKVTFDDGSVQYLGSYCSPNTYLVEQL